jgi:hypothetical protein
MAASPRPPPELGIAAARHPGVGKLQLRAPRVGRRPALGLRMFGMPLLFFVILFLLFNSDLTIIREPGLLMVTRRKEEGK